MVSITKVKSIVINLAWTKIWSLNKVAAKAWYYGNPTKSIEVKTNKIIVILLLIIILVLQLLLIIMIIIIINGLKVLWASQW